MLLCVMDSLLVVRQMDGTYSTRQPRLQALRLWLRSACAELGVPVERLQMPRARNWQADYLAAQAAIRSAHGDSSCIDL